MDEAAQGEVRLTLPARPDLLRVARLTAAVLAGRLGFSLDEIDDTKIAVDELCFALIGPRGRDGELRLVYRLAPGELAVEGAGRFPMDGGQVPRPSELSARILAVVADEHALDLDDGGVSFRLVKRRAG